MSGADDIALGNTVRVMANHNYPEEVVVKVVRAYRAQLAHQHEKLFEHRGDGTVWGQLPDGRFVELIEKPQGALHCSTCQCSKLHAQIPVPGNPMSRSWHDNGCQSADAALVKITSMEQLAAEARKCESLLSSLNGGYGK
jgi:hypothetical protein